MSDAGLWGGLTDVPGLRVGMVADAEALTGLTVVLTEGGAVGAASVMGGAPGTFGTDPLQPLKNNEALHGVVLTGGSAFGLASVGGVMRWLEERGIGLQTRVAPVPIVAGAVIFDLAVGAADVRPTAEWGYRAASEAAGGPFPRGNVGAGTGATTGKWRGGLSVKGGLGTASLSVDGGVIVAALIVVNAVGDVVNPRTRRFYATDGGFDRSLIAEARQWDRPEGFYRSAKPDSTAPENTTIGVVATNARLDKLQMARVAQQAHLGLARAIRPVHTSGDGDALFALSVGGDARVDLNGTVTGVYTDVIGGAAADAVTLAVLDALLAAEGIAGFPAAREVLSAVPAWAGQ